MKETELVAQPVDGDGLPLDDAQGDIHPLATVIIVAWSPSDLLIIECHVYDIAYRLCTSVR